MEIGGYARREVEVIGLQMIMVVLAMVTTTTILLLPIVSQFVPFCI